MKRAMICLLALAAIVFAVPLSAQAGDFTYGKTDISTQVVAGYTLADGLNDPGEAVAISLNNILSVINENLTLPGYQLSWKEHRVLELGIISGGYGGPQGSDVTDDKGDGSVFVAAGARLLETVNGSVIYYLDSRRESNIKTFVGVDVAALGPKLVTWTSTLWGKTGL
jgi:hypothetical protein